jgi:hypothetical protein
MGKDHYLVLIADGEVRCVDSFDHLSSSTLKHTLKESLNSFNFVIKRLDQNLFQTDYERLLNLIDHYECEYILTKSMTIEGYYLFYLQEYYEKNKDSIDSHEIFIIFQ